VAETLETLIRQIRGCRHCVVSPIGKPLPHEPRPIVRASRSARICISGQAPGTRVHASGVPFADPSGVRLRDWLGVSEDEFYDESRIAIIPMGFCFPGLDQKGSDLPPRRECAPLWQNRLFAQLPGIELLVLVGQYSQKWYLGRSCKPSLTETVKNWREYALADDGELSQIPLPHPSWRNSGWLKKNLWFADEVLPHLRQEVRRLLG
jgi:uracil-DNA glycosylase